MNKSQELKIKILESQIELLEIKKLSLDEQIHLIEEKILKIKSRGGETPSE